MDGDVERGLIEEGQAIGKGRLDPRHQTLAASSNVVVTVLGVAILGAWQRRSSAAPPVSIWCTFERTSLRSLIVFRLLIEDRAHWLIDPCTFKSKFAMVMRSTDLVHLQFTYHTDCHITATSADVSARRGKHDGSSSVAIS